MNYTEELVANEGKILTLVIMRFILDCRASSGGLSCSYQEYALPAELCGSPTLYTGGGRIRTYAALTGGRFTVCSD